MMTRRKMELWSGILLIATGLAAGCGARAPSADLDGATMSTTTSRPTSLDEGRDLFYRLVSGEKQHARECQDYWTTVHRDDPHNPLATAYLGATITFGASL